jgi:preprotein translocase subunit SecY
VEISKKQDPFTEDTVSRRILVTFGVLTLIRVGISIPVPEVDQALLGELVRTKSFLVGFSLFLQGKFFVLGLLSLGILPNINASLAIQYLTRFVPFLKNLQKQGGMVARSKFAFYTRVLTFLIALQYSIVISFLIKNVMFHTSFITQLELVLILTTGSLITMWLGDFITQYGLGKGPSLIIFGNIISSVPTLISGIHNPRLTGLFIICILIAIIYVQEAYARIVIVSPKSLLSELDGDELDFTYIPFTLNPGGILPIIFVSSITSLPGLSYLLNPNFPLSLPFFFSVYCIIQCFILKNYFKSRRRFKTPKRVGVQYC